MKDGLYSIEWDDGGKYDKDGHPPSDFLNIADTKGSTHDCLIRQRTSGKNQTSLIVFDHVIFMFLQLRKLLEHDIT